MCVVYVAYKSFLGKWFKLEVQSKLSSDHKRPVLVTTTSANTRLSCDLNFVMKSSRRQSRPLWALPRVFIQIKTLSKPHIGIALLDLKLFWSKLENLAVSINVNVTFFCFICLFVCFLWITKGRTIRKNRRWGDNSPHSPPPKKKFLLGNLSKKNSCERRYLKKSYCSGSDMRSI